MHNNFFFLQHLTKSIKEKILDSRLIACFSQNKDELIIEFENKGLFYIKANLSPSLCCLSFPSKFSRAKKNSVDLFSELLNLKIINVRQFKNDRSFAIEFEHEWALLFKMHETRSNIIFIQSCIAKSIFRNHLKTDLTINLNELDRQIDWTQEYFLKNQATIHKAYFTFGRRVWTYLETQGYTRANSENKWALIQNILTQFEQSKFFVSEFNNQLSLFLFSHGKNQKEFSDPIEAINYFFQNWSITDQLDVKKKEFEKITRIKINKAEKYIETNSNKLKELTGENLYRQWADLLMANLSNINLKQNKIVVDNFYKNNDPIEIPLKIGVSIQKNAEIYYRKAKNQNKEIDKLKESILAKKELIVQLTNSLEESEKIQDIKIFNDKFDAVKKDSSHKPVLPFHITTVDGFEILIGKNSSSNDLLTLKYAKKDDLWLHVKDVAGSHVVIKSKPGTNFPKHIIERGAELAAYYSKRKNEKLCPVAYTEKKYVRKRKGDPAGVVVVEKEKVILVEPRNI